MSRTADSAWVDRARDALETHGSIAAAARALGCTRHTLRRALGRNGQLVLALESGVRRRNAERVTRRAASAALRREKRRREMPQLSLWE